MLLLLLLLSAHVECVRVILVVLAALIHLNSPKAQVSGHKWSVSMSRDFFLATLTYNDDG